MVNVSRVTIRRVGGLDRQPTEGICVDPLKHPDLEFINRLGKDVAQYSRFT